MDWIKYKKVYFSFSAIMIALCIFGFSRWGLKLGVDFVGGTLLEYRLENTISTEEFIGVVSNEGIEISSIQETGETSYLLRMPPISSEEKDKIAEELVRLSQDEVEELRFETVGPAVGPEMIKKTVYAIVLAALGIFSWIALQFRNLRFGVSAVLATLHDSFILIGSFSFLGYFFGAEIDFLIITAALTTISFSVHDTIVVFDRIRENSRKYKGNLKDTANRSVSETMVRSLNNSFTLIFMLVAIILLGGTTIQWFAAALLIGAVFGTYSSPFVAVPILVTFNELEKKFKK